MDNKWRLARIRSAWLGIEDHGFLTYIIGLDYADEGGKIGSGSQGFGLRVLWTESQGGTKRSIALIGELLVAVGVDSWDALPGRMVWAQASHDQVHRIKGLDAGIVFDPALTAREDD